MDTTITKQPVAETTYTVTFSGMTGFELATLRGLVSWQASWSEQARRQEPVMKAFRKTFDASKNPDVYTQLNKHGYR